MFVKNFFRSQRSSILMILSLLAFRSSFADQYLVPTGSMQPTIQIGDHVAVNKMAYDLKIPFLNWTLAKLNEPKRGDIVVFLYPKDPSIHYIKRLVGLPGDKILVKNGFVTINGLATPLLSSENPQLATYFEIWKGEKVPILRNFASREFSSQALANSEVQELTSLDVQSFTVPQGQYFFMGDNRDNSSDSRYWGFVPREYIKGQALGTLWNISFHNFLPRINPTRFFKELI